MFFSERNVCMNGIVFLRTTFLSTFHIQSIIKPFALTLDNILAIEFSGHGIFASLFRLLS